MTDDRAAHLLPEDRSEIEVVPQTKRDIWLTREEKRRRPSPAMTDDRAALDGPRERLLAALAEHPNATYVRVEAIDLRAALALPPDLSELSQRLEKLRQEALERDKGNPSGYWLGYATGLEAACGEIDARLKQ
jgi:hypothetical protein